MDDGKLHALVELRDFAEAVQTSVDDLSSVLAFPLGPSRYLWMEKKELYIQCVSSRWVGEV